MTYGAGGSEDRTVGHSLFWFSLRDKLPNSDTASEQMIGTDTKHLSDAGLCPSISHMLFSPLTTVRVRVIINPFVKLSWRNLPVVMQWVRGTGGMIPEKVGVPSSLPELCCMGLWINFMDFWWAWLDLFAPWNTVVPHPCIGRMRSAWAFLVLCLYASQLEPTCLGFSSRPLKSLGSSSHLLVVLPDTTLSSHVKPRKRNSFQLGGIVTYSLLPPTDPL